MDFKLVPTAHSQIAVSMLLTIMEERCTNKLSTVGKFIRIFATGPHFFCIAACQDRLYITTIVVDKMYVYDTNGKLIRRISVPAVHACGVIVGIDGNLYVSNWQRKKVYTYTPE